MARKKKIEIEQIEEDIITTDYCDEMSASFIDYAVSVITDRAIPDVRDGLKPVHRRILWAMKLLGLLSSGDYKKTARIVGETMGKFHPHGNTSIYDALVHMSQGWCYNHPLVDGHGNFGSVEGDDAAADRYTEAKLSPITEEILLSDLDKGVVDFIPNFDNKEKEPSVLPATVPNILISGTDGIAVGMASKMPTHNLCEVIDAVVAVLDNPKIKEDKLFDYIKGPDFATGGIIVNKSELPEIYKNGAGRIRIRGRVKTEAGERGKTNIVITEIPYTMIGAIDKFMDTVADLVRAKVMPDVTDIKNFSGKEGVRIVVELRKDADVQQNINLLYKKAKLEDTFGYNAMLLSDGVPYQMSLARILNEFVTFYRETMTRKYKYLLDKEKKFAEVREGLITAVDQIDAIIEMFRGCPTVPVAKKCLTKGITEGIKFKTKTCEKQAKKFHFTELQADAILEMKLQKLIGLEMTTLEKELAKAKKNIEVYSGLVTSKVKMSHKMKSDILEIKKKYAIERKTEIIDAETIVLKKPEIKEEKVYALVNRFGYIKLVDEATYERNQENIPADYRYICEVMNTGRLFVFTERGKCHQIKVKDVPMGRYNDKGVPLEQVSALTMEENAITVISDYKPKEKLLFVTKNGYVKKVSISEFISSRKTTDATKLGAKDTLVAVELIKDKKTVVLVSEKKMCVAFEIGSVSNLKKNTVGIIGMKFDKGDFVKFVATVGDDNKFIVDEKQHDVTKINSGKRATKGKLLK